MALLSEGFESYSDLDKAVKSIESAIKRSNKASGEGEEEVSGRLLLPPLLIAPLLKILSHLRNDTGG